MKQCFLFLVISLSAVFASAQFESLSGEASANANQSESLSNLAPQVGVVSGENGEPISDTQESAFSGAANAGIASGLIKGAQKAQKGGQTSYLIGAGFAGACGYFNPWFCAAAALSFLNGKKAFNQAKKLNRQAQDLLTQSNPELEDQLDLDIEANAQSEANASAGLSELENQGFVVSGDGNSVTGPDGQTFAGGDLQSASSLQAAGVPADKAQDYENKLRSLQANAENNAGGGAAGGSGRGAEVAGAGRGINFSGLGGGGRGIASSEVSKADAAGTGGVAKRLTSGEANKYSKNFLGTPIGISRGDVFGIVTKKYQTSDKQNTFFKREY